METPNTPAGHQTEAIMAAVHRRLTALPTHQYNAIYSSVLEVLSAGPAAPSSPLSQTVFARAMRRRAFAGQ